jgi:ribosomal-protein-alanine N-acetyltransferase
MPTNAPRWPLILRSENLTLRPLRLRDRAQWDQLRSENLDWLSPWEATLPQIQSEGDTHKLPSFFAMVSSHNREGRAGRSLTLAIWYQNKMAGQISMGGIIYGALRGAHVGYWIDKRYANLGITTQAVKTLTEYAFSVLELHRVEINIRPENVASRRVAEKSGYVFEGERPRYLHIDGHWRDHICFVRENPNIS